MHPYRRALRQSLDRLGPPPATHRDLEQSPLAQPGLAQEPRRHARPCCQAWQRPLDRLAAPLALDSDFFQSRSALLRWILALPPRPWRRAGRRLPYRLPALLASQKDFLRLRVPSAPLRSVPGPPAHPYCRAWRPRMGKHESTLPPSRYRLPPQSVSPASMQEPAACRCWRAWQLLLKRHDRSRKYLILPFSMPREAPPGPLVRPCYRAYELPQDRFL